MTSPAPRVLLVLRGDEQPVVRFDFDPPRMHVTWLGGEPDESLLAVRTPWQTLRPTDGAAFLDALQRQLARRPGWRCRLEPAAA